MPAGRPTDYTPELAEKFCGFVATHSLSRKNICAKYKNELPHDTTISEWLAKYPEFRSRYLEAKEIQALSITDELWDELTLGLSKEELEVFDRKFRFHQWHLSKLAPKQFGDKKEVKSDITANIALHEDKLKELE